MFFKNKDKDESIAIIDIGSGSVGAGIISLSGKRSPKIIYTTRSPIIFQEKLDFEMFRRSMFASLENALNQLTHEGVKKLGEAGVVDKKIDRLFIIFASPWYTARTKTVVLKKGVPVIFSEKFINDIIDAEVGKLVGDNTSTENQNKTSDLQLVEHRLIDVKLNGYTLANPYGKKAREIEMTLFMSLVPKSLLTATSSLIEQFFHTDNIDFHSFALSSYSFIRDHFEDSNDYIIVDVSSEMTDIFVADDGKLTNSTSFPFGTRSIIRMMTSKFGISEQESRSALRMFGNGDLHDNEALKVKEVLAGAGREWSKLFNKSFIQVAGEARAEKAFIISESNFEKIIKDFLINQGKEGRVLDLTDKEIVLIQPAFFKNFIDMAGSSDAFIASEAYYADKLLKQV